MYRLHESTVQGCFWWRGPAGIDASVEIGMRMGRYRRAPGEAELKSLNTTAEKTEVVRIGLLGGFRVSVGGRTIGEDAWRLRKAASLTKLLALTKGHRLHRERVMYLLWPDLAKKAASNNLSGDHPRRPQGTGRGGLPLPGLRGRVAGSVSWERPLGRRRRVRGGHARRQALPRPGGLPGGHRPLRWRPVARGPL